MKLKVLLATLLFATTGSFAQTQFCTSVNITSMSQNYLPLYHQQTAYELQYHTLYYGPIRLTASNAFQNTTDGGPDTDCAGDGAYVGPTLSYVENNNANVYSAGVVAQSPLPPPGPGYNDLYFTVNYFSTMPLGKQNLWVLDEGPPPTYYSASNGVTFWVDEPAYMLVVSDNTYQPAPPSHPNVWRQVIYEVHNTSGSLVPQINIGENVTYTQSSPPCSGSIQFTPSSCSQPAPAVTNTYGKFTDQWAVNSTATPAGCGVSNIVDHWQACSPKYTDRSLHSLPVKTFGTLTGYIHTNAVDILGSITPPQTNHMITGRQINP
jgi:hypothetical protein